MDKCMWIFTPTTTTAASSYDRCWRKLATAPLRQLIRVPLVLEDGRHVVKCRRCYCSSRCR